MPQVAAGILIYMGLVDLMATDIFSQHMRSQRTQYQAGCLAALFLGAAGMVHLVPLPQSAGIKCSTAKTLRYLAIRFPCMQCSSATALV